MGSICIIQTAGQRSRTIPATVPPPEVLPEPPVASWIFEAISGLNILDMPMFRARSSIDYDLKPTIPGLVPTESNVTQGCALANPNESTQPRSPPGSIFKSFLGLKSLGGLISKLATSVGAMFARKPPNGSTCGSKPDQPRPPVRDRKPGSCALSFVLADPRFMFKMVSLILAVTVLVYLCICLTWQNAEDVRHSLAPRRRLCRPSCFDWCSTFYDGRDGIYDDDGRLNLVIKKTGTDGLGAEVVVLRGHQEYPDLPGDDSDEDGMERKVLQKLDEFDRILDGEGGLRSHGSHESHDTAAWYVGSLSLIGTLGLTAAHQLTAAQEVVNSTIIDTNLKIDVFPDAAEHVWILPMLAFFASFFGLWTIVSCFFTDCAYQLFWPSCCSKDKGKCGKHFCVFFKNRKCCAICIFLLLLIIPTALLLCEVLDVGGDPNVSRNVWHSIVEAQIPVP